MNYNLLKSEFDKQRECSFKSHHELIFDILANHIITLELPPQCVLQESQLAKYFDVSRTPIRQALIKLEESDFVTSIPNRGYQVNDIDISNFKDLSMLRLSIECVAAQQAASRATVEQLLVLENILEQMKAHQSSPLNDKMKLFVNLESQFHNSLCLMSQNTYLIQLYDKIAPKLLHLRYFYSHRNDLNVDSQIMLSMYEEHLIIYLAIKSRNPTLAYEAVRQHISRLLHGLD